MSDNSWSYAKKLISTVDSDKTFNYFPTHNGFCTNEITQISRYSIAILMENILASYIPQFHQFRHVQIRAAVLCITGSNHPYSFPIPLIRRKFHSDRLFPSASYFMEQTPQRILPQTLRMCGRYNGQRFVMRNRIAEIEFQSSSSHSLTRK